MSRRRLSLAALLAVSLTGVLDLACSGGPEQAILTHFFTAARLRDNSTLGSFATADFDPRTKGIITSFTITNIGPEQRKPVNMKALVQAELDAKAADEAFTKRKLEYQDQNLETIERIVRAGRQAKLKGKDAEVQAAWFKIVDEGSDVGRKLSEAKRRLANEKDIVELSAVDPGRTLDVTKYDGDMVSKDVTIEAPVKLPDGRTEKKTLIVTLERAELKGETPIVGRWIVATIKEPGTPGGTKTS